MHRFPETESTFLLPGPVGGLEVLATPAATANASAVGIICHPHPLHGGTMHNKVVSTLARVFRDVNLASVRFNYRGVGKSVGSYAEGDGELADLLAVAAWIREVYPDKPLWLAGFSFGACVSLRAASMLDIAQLISIAPPISRCKVNALPACPWVLVQGENDEVVMPDEVFAWIDSLAVQPQVIRMPETSHYFHGKLLELRNLLLNALG